MFYDIRVSEGNSEIISIENGNLNITSSPFSSSGVRYVHNGIGFASAPKFSDSMIEKAKKLSELSDTKINFPETGVIKSKIKSRIREDPVEIPLSEKIEFIKEISSMLDAENVSYKNVLMRIISGKKYYSNSSGSSIETPVNNIVFYLKISGGKDLQSSFFSVGVHGGYESIRKFNFKYQTEKLVNRHKKLLSARKAPAGRYPVILDPALTGVFFHEAVGHACEADAVLQKASVFTGKLGKKISNKGLTMSDDPTLRAFGTYKYDDEGIRARSKDLIKDGYLTGYLHSRETAYRMKAEPTGNGRVQDSGRMPIPRMSNIVIKKGDSSFTEMVGEVRNGIYLVGSKGGVVNPITGNFLFNASYGYVIKNGEKKEMVSDVSLSGNILETLKNIELIGKKPVVLPRTGFCGKMGQNVPVDEKSPYLMLSEAIVGGH